MDIEIARKPVRVAVVDDDRDILDALSLLLAYQSWNVGTYETGDALLSDLDTHYPDCVLLDPHIPGLSGVEVASALARFGIPVVGLTARPESPTAIQVVRAGAVTMLTKPATEEVLVKQIKKAIAQESRSCK